MSVPPDRPDPSGAVPGPAPETPGAPPAARPEGPAQPPLPPRRGPRWALVPTGAPYHLLARNSVHRWWRPLVTVLLFAGLAVVSLFAAAALYVPLVLLLSPRLLVAVLEAGPGPGVNPLADPVLVMLLGFAVLAALIPATLFTTWWAQRRPFGSVCSVTGVLRWRWLGECVAAGVAVFGVMFGLGVVATLLTGGVPWQGFPGWRDYLAIVVVALVVVPFQAASEEFVFRGLLLQTLTAWFRTPWVGMVVSSLLFLSAHGYTDPLVWFELVLLAMTMCWLSIRTGGLEAAIGLHVCNNSLSLLVGGLSGVPDLRQAGDFSVVQVLPLVVAILVYAWIVDRRAARRGVDTVVGGRQRIAPLSLRPVSSA